MAYNLAAVTSSSSDAYFVSLSHGLSENGSDGLSYHRAATTVNARRAIRKKRLREEAKSTYLQTLDDAMEGLAIRKDSDAQAEIDHCVEKMHASRQAGNSILAVSASHQVEIDRCVEEMLAISAVGKKVPETPASRLLGPTHLSFEVAELNLLDFRPGCPLTLSRKRRAEPESDEVTFRCKKLLMEDEMEGTWHRLRAMSLSGKKNVPGKVH